MTVESDAAPLRTMIVDDEPLAVERLQLLCARLPRISLVGTASDGESALRLAEQLKPELVFLDINMPRLDGMGVARALGKTGQSPAIIFVTAYQAFAVEAFDLAAIDYLLKPVATDRLERAVARVLERRSAVLANPPATPPAQGDWVREFWVPHRSELKRIDADLIERIDAERDYMRLHVGTRSYLMHETIKTLEERLDPSRFVRLHRSHIVRNDYITSLRHNGGGVWFACLADGSELRVGRTYLARVKEMAGR
ncbi:MULTISPECIES: response regulator transcription factor [Pseudomonadota]|uniref:LytR/AlgR family response regulator transcription factor n=1 Tax=Pseudomonadota TaxID=1224 RepID=UPI00076A792A|nr:MULTISPECIES: response regulator transcription factor [Pseudomonadota]MAF61328.1 DNA-binding response regulator [Blastomonas sp.]